MNEVIIREAYFNSLKSTPTKESIRFSYLDSCKKGFTGSYREYCKHLQIIHQQEQMKVEREETELLQLLNPQISSFSMGTECIAHHEKEMWQREKFQSKHLKVLQQLLNEIYDKSLNLPHRQFQISYSRVLQFHRLFVKQPYESVNYEGDPPISSAFVEREIAKYISECLVNTPEQTLDIQQIEEMIRDYKVVQPLGQKNHSVSLERVHSILEDNFQDSSLCKLLNILLKGDKNTRTKVVTFF